MERKREIKDESKLRNYAKQILTGLVEMHSNNIIHADIKLPNILRVKPSAEEKA